MYNPRQNLDLDSMLDKTPTPNRLRMPTPIRKAPIKMIPNKQNMINPGNQWMSRNFQDISQKGAPMQENTNRKPLISPVRNPFKSQIQSINGEQKRGNKIMRRQTQPLQQPYNDSQTCVNHPKKSAEFNIDIEDECLAYCGRCAAQLASQGFEVNKIEVTVKKGDNRRFPQREQPQARSLPRYPEYQGNPLYELILQFLTELSQVENDHLQNMNKLAMMDNHYNQQIEQTKNFYTQLLSFIEQMRDDHLNDLYEQSRKHSQIADIEHDYLRENVDQIGTIRNDIEQNLETIVEKIDKDELRNNLNYYKQKLQVYCHKVEDQTDFFNQIISFSTDQYQSKLARVQDFLMDVWKSQNDQDQSPQQEKIILEQPKPLVAQKQPSSLIKAPNQNFPLKNVSPSPQNIKKSPAPNPVPQNENQPAFRRLFQEEEPVMAETSPQFKKI